MGKLTISMAIFNSKLLVYQRVPPNILNWAEVSSRKIRVPLAVLLYHGIMIYVSTRPDIETFKHGEVHQPCQLRHPQQWSPGIPTVGTAHCANIGMDNNSWRLKGVRWWGKWLAGLAQPHQWLRFTSVFRATTRLQDFRGNPIEKPPTFEGNYPPLVPLFSFFEHQMCCTQPWSQLKTVPKNLSYPHGRMVWVKSCGHKRGWFPIKTHGLNQANRENRVRSL